MGVPQTGQGSPSLLWTRYTFASLAPVSRSSRPRSSSESIASASVSTCPGDSPWARGERGQLRRVQDLVRPSAADAGDHALVAEQGVQPPRLVGEDLAETLDAEAKRLRAQVLELRLGRLGREQPDARPLLRAAFGEDELPAALEQEPERRRLRALLTGLEVAEAAGRHQVDEQDELAVLRREEKPLGPTIRSREPPAVERGERRIERLQRRDVRRPGLLDRKRGDGIVERAAPSFHLWQFRHLV